MPDFERNWALSFCVINLYNYTRLMNNEQKQELSNICDRLANVAFMIYREANEEKSEIKMVYELATILQDVQAELLTIPHMKSKDKDLTPGKFICS